MQQIQEHILVVPRTALFAHQPAWHGIKSVETDWLINQVKTHGIFMPRSHAEHDETYKQIISYLIFAYQDSIFVMERKKTASEQRLARKLSIGIGGHLRQEDTTQNDLLSWALREFHEEVFYQDSYSSQLLGIINDDSNSVGRVHLGIALLLTGSTPNIYIKDEHKSGQLINMHALADLNNFEAWSALILGFLRNQRL